jgi:xanthine dehydrogenase YagS FAD-binding subunit
MGTVGGELLQRPRCWYFRRGKGLLAVKDGKSLVEAGDNRYHAVFGNGGPAKFVHASSLAPALIALGASVEVSGKDGSRTLSVAELYRAPEKDGEREHAVEPGEILTAIRVPAAAPKSATYEVRHRQGLDWPEAAASVRLDMDGAKVRSASVVLGHVAPTPWSTSAGETLAGKEVTAETAAAAADQAVEGATPLSMNGYKVELARVAARRAILLAAGKQV